jgi:transcriptional regulator with XRE-family HTH domain
LGLVVREQREARDWSQERLAHAAGLSPVYISEIERGRRSPSLDVLARLAAGLDQRLSELIARAERV